jgi:hypothetical protein
MSATERILDWGRIVNFSMATCNLVEAIGEATGMPGASAFGRISEALLLESNIRGTALMALSARTLHQSVVNPNGHAAGRRALEGVQAVTSLAGGALRTLTWLSMAEVISLGAVSAAVGYAGAGLGAAAILLMVVRMGADLRRLTRAIEEAPEEERAALIEQQRRSRIQLMAMVALMSLPITMQVVRIAGTQLPTAARVSISFVTSTFGLIAMWRTRPVLTPAGQNVQKSLAEKVEPPVDSLAL